MSWLKQAQDPGEVWKVGDGMELPVQVYVVQTGKRGDKITLPGGTLLAVVGEDNVNGMTRVFLRDKSNQTYMVNSMTLQKNAHPVSDTGDPGEDDWQASQKQQREQREPSYWDSVQSIAEEIFKENPNEDDWNDQVFESVDSSSWIIYNAQNDVVLRETRNQPDSRETQALAGPDADWQKLKQVSAFQAMEGDVYEALRELKEKAEEQEDAKEPEDTRLMPGPGVHETNYGVANKCNCRGLYCSHGSADEGKGCANLAGEGHFCPTCTKVIKDKEGWPATPFEYKSDEESSSKYQGGMAGKPDNPYSYTERLRNQKLDVEDAPQSVSDIGVMNTKQRQMALDQLLDQYNATEDPKQKDLLETKMRELRAAMSGWLRKQAEATLCDACSADGHDPEKDWEACTWGECECPCQSDSKKEGTKKQAGDLDESNLPGQQQQGAKAECQRCGGDGGSFDPQGGTMPCYHCGTLGYEPPDCPEHPPAPTCNICKGETCVACNGCPKGSKACDQCACESQYDSDQAEMEGGDLPYPGSSERDQSPF